MRLVKFKLGGIYIRVPDWCRWLSMDEDGTWNGWSNLPIAGDDKWETGRQAKPEQGPVIVHLGPKNNPCWRDTMILLKENR